MSNKLNLLQLNKDGSAYYYYGKLYNPYNGLINIFDADYLPISESITDSNDFYEFNFPNSYVFFEPEIYEIDVYLKLHKEGYLEEIRLLNKSKEYIEENYEIDISNLSREDQVKHRKNGIFDNSYFINGYKKITNFKSSMKSSRGKIAFYNYNEDYNHKYYDDDSDKELGTEILQNSINNMKDLTYLSSKFKFCNGFLDDIWRSFDESNNFGFCFLWESGDYDVFNCFAEKEVKIYEPKDFNFLHPCCKKKDTYNKENFSSRWGVRYFQCPYCDKKTPIGNEILIEKVAKYFEFKDGSLLDVNRQGIKGIYEPDYSSIYGCIIRPSDKKNETNLSFMFEEKLE